MFGFAVLAASGLTLAVFLIILPVVQYFRDPKGLRKFENYSFLSGITNLCYCYLSACGFRSKDLYEAHKRNPILRVGPNSLSFGDIRAIKDIYGRGTKCTKDLNYVILKGSHTCYPQGISPHLIDVVDKADHARKRKLMSAAFAIKNLERWEHKVAHLTQRLVETFDGLCTKLLSIGQVTPDQADLTVDFNKWINLWTIEAINNIALSATLGLLEQGSDEVTAQRPDGTLYKAHYRQAQNQTSFAQSVFVWDYDRYHILAWLSKLVPMWRQVWKEAEPWNDVALYQVDERLKRYQEGEKLDDFFTCLMEDKTGTPNNLECGEIISEASIIINAGADTTAIALTQLLEPLLRHPEHLDILRQELDSVLDGDEVVAPYDKVKDLPFLRACLDEGLRLIPPTSAGLPRRTPPEGARILDQWIPGDTSVSMTIYATHRDPSVFPNPEEFQPNRWLDPESRKRMEPYFIPFTTGARGCIGRNISYLEQAVVVASLIHRYEFAFPSAEWRLQRHEAFNILVGELPVKIWRRQDLAEVS
jgi:cytochrome P450